MDPAVRAFDERCARGLQADEARCRLYAERTVSLATALAPRLGYARAAEIVKAKGLTQVSDEGTLEKIIDEVMAKNPQQVAQYKSGKEAVFGYFVGQVMKASDGKANPAKVNELLKRKLAQ